MSLLPSATISMSAALVFQTCPVASGRLPWYCTFICITDCQKASFVHSFAAPSRLEVLPGRLETPGLWAPAEFPARADWKGIGQAGSLRPDAFEQTSPPPPLPILWLSSPQPLRSTSYRR